MNQLSRSDWDRPRGVSQGNWQYIRDESIASGYDESLAQSPLVSIDQTIIQRHLPPSKDGLIIDFGCGTGRNSIPLLVDGRKVLGIDLSRPMLNRFRAKLPANAKATLVHANLTNLAGIRPNIGDFGQCMFSTFGMISGKAYRSQFLSHAARVLKKGAPLIIHVHNYWHHLRIQGGLLWLLGNGWQAMRGQCELGDRFADYRSVQHMMLHHFSLRSLERELRPHGFETQTSYAILPNNTVTAKISQGSFGSAVGWILVAGSP